MVVYNKHKRKGIFSAGPAPSDLLHTDPELEPDQANAAPSVLLHYDTHNQLAPRLVQRPELVRDKAREEGGLHGRVRAGLRGMEDGSSKKHSLGTLLAEHHELNGHNMDFILAPAHALWLMDPVSLSQSSKTQGS